MLPDLAVISGGSGRDERRGNAGGQRLAQFRRFNLHGDHAQLFGKGGRGRVIAAELDALGIGRTAHFLIEVEPLAGPRAGIERHKVQVRQLGVHAVTGRFPQFRIVGIAGRNKGQVVPPQQGCLVGVGRHESFADGHLTGLDRALDIPATEQRAAGMHGDVDRAIGVFGHPLGEQNALFGMVVCGRIGHRHVPVLRVAVCHGGRGRQGQCDARFQSICHDVSRLVGPFNGLCVLKDQKGSDRCSAAPLQ
mmetsp:Transcript_28786/g.54712  ORF Transcript_28786/g.54712 Transcript_28786/m.54712 type:complete len:249 (+) Transcript_28786:538-1284(+)